MQNTYNTLLLRKLSFSLSNDVTYLSTPEVRNFFKLLCLILLRLKYTLEKLNNIKELIRTNWQKLQLTEHKPSNHQHSLPTPFSF